MKKQPLLYPYFIAIFPILSLLSSNITQLDADLGLRSLIFTALLCALLLILGKLIFKNIDKSALLISLIAVLFFSYGHVYLAIEDFEIGGFVLGRHRFLIPVWILLFGAVLIWIWRTKSDAGKWRLNLNITSIILTLMPALSIAYFYFSLIITPPLDPLQTSISTSTHDQNNPDIYYIILDSYARQDVLEIMYNYDNSTFLNELESLGFVIANDAQANYPNTALSISSSLNMNYIEEFSGPHDPSSNKLTPLYERIRDSLVFKIFKDMGYSTVAFETGYNGTEIKKADLYLSPPEKESGIFGPPNMFEGLLISTSAYRIVTEFSSFFPDWIKPDLSAAFNDHRERILFDFAELIKLPQLDGPKLVFLHIISPHAPFIFDANGVPLTPEGFLTLEVDGHFSSRSNFIDGYVNQVKYLNNRLLEAIKIIQETSEIPPIIILQADHGTGASTIGDTPSPLPYLDERLTILNVFNLPNCGDNQIHSDITPVNTFRFILANCFNEDYELIPDKTFMSNYNTPYDLYEKTEKFPEK